ncbi:COP1-interactive protein 1-like [Vigna unguiculata]|nr:COP1-interactive protein 1-like [Vigna unguiculata]
MFKHRLRGFSKSFGGHIDPQKSEALKRTKTDMETELSRIAKLIKNEEQCKKDGKSMKVKEFVWLVEDFYIQSLYPQYSRLTGEYVKSDPSKVDKMSSASSSSSESEYFSAEETDYYSDISDSNQKPFPRETEPSTLELRNPELRVKQLLFTQNADLHRRIFELQVLLNKSKGTVSVLQGKLQTNEDRSASKIAELMARIRELEHEAKTMRTQKGKSEEKIRRNRSEALNQKKDFDDQINAMQHMLDSVRNHSKELEVQLERTRVEASQSCSDLAEEKECFLARIRELELELESRCRKQHHLEDRNNELERAMARRVQEISELRRDHEDFKEGATMHAEALKALVEKLKTSVVDSEETIDKLTECIEQMDAENREARIEYEEKELMLKEMVWKLEAMVSKEGGVKLNLMKEVKQLERKVEKLERIVKEKDYELMGLAEKKKEAIRQLCSLVEFHRNRYFYLKDSMSKSKRFW